MGDEEYSDKTLRVIFKGFDEKLDAIHEQARCTNGRVSSLENWRWFITGGLALLTVLVIPVLIAFVVR